MSNLKRHRGEKEGEEEEPRSKEVNLTDNLFLLPPPVIIINNTIQTPLTTPLTIPFATSKPKRVYNRKTDDEKFKYVRPGRPSKRDENSGIVKFLRTTEYLTMQYDLEGRSILDSGQANNQYGEVYYNTFNNQLLDWGAYRVYKEGYTKFNSCFGTNFTGWKDFYPHFIELGGKIFVTPIISEENNILNMIEKMWQKISLRKLLHKTKHEPSDPKKKYGAVYLITFDTQKLIEYGYIKEEDVAGLVKSEVYKELKEEDDHFFKIVDEEVNNVEELKDFTYYDSYKDYKFRWLS